MKIIMLTKQDSRQVQRTDTLLTCPSRGRGACFTDCVPFVLQMCTLQVCSLPSMTALYSLEVSAASCLVQTRINMVPASPRGRQIMCGIWKCSDKRMDISLLYSHFHITNAFKIILVVIIFVPRSLFFATNHLYELRFSLACFLF